MWSGPQNITLLGLYYGYGLISTEEGVSDRAPRLYDVCTIDQGRVIYSTEQNPGWSQASLRFPENTSRGFTSVLLCKCTVIMSVISQVAVKYEYYPHMLRLWGGGVQYCFYLQALKVAAYSSGMGTVGCGAAEVGRIWFHFGWVDECIPI